MPDRALITPRRSADCSGDPGHLGTSGYPAVERLTDNPRSGRVVPELGDESIREVIHGNYRTVYRLRHDVVEIATVFHDARLFRLD